MYSDDRFLNKLKSGNLSTSEATKLFRKLTWSRAQMFRTVSHHTMDGAYKFPCNTVGGPRMGSPCSFPFVYPDCSENVKPIVLLMLPLNNFEVFFRKIFFNLYHNRFEPFHKSYLRSQLFVAITKQASQDIMIAVSLLGITMIKILDGVTLEPTSMVLPYEDSGDTVTRTADREKILPSSIWPVKNTTLCGVKTYLCLWRQGRVDTATLTIQQQVLLLMKDFMRC